MKEHAAKIGVLGVGLLGSAIAERLTSFGWSTCGHDPAGFSLRDVHACSNAGEVIRTTDRIILSLPNSHIALKLIQDQQAAFRKGQIVMDTTTGKPETMERMARILEDAGVGYVETTVAGSSELLRQGENAIFIGGQTECVQQVMPLIEQLSKHAFHIGDVGAASRFKLVHNLVLGLHRAVLAEGLTFAKVMGMDEKTALEILKQTPAASDVMHTKGTRMIDGDYLPPQARVSQHLKDVRLMLEQAKNAGNKVPFTSLHQILLEQAESLGYGEQDNSAIIEVYRHGLHLKETHGA